jgi:hypothetical protein
MNALKNRKSQPTGLNWMGYGLLFLAAACTLTACGKFAVVGGGAAGAGGAVFTVGANQIGESCRVVASSPDYDIAGVQAAYNVVCGNWEKPSARVVGVKSDKNALELAT